jgi:hypothetical protein
MQHFLKPAAGAARATIVSAELLQQLLVRVDHALAALNARFGRISFAPFTRDLETGIRRAAWRFSWHFSFEGYVRPNRCSSCQKAKNPWQVHPPGAF